MDPNAVIRVSLRDGTTAVDTNSILFAFDGLPVAPTIQKAGALTIVQYDPPGVLAGNSTHNYRMVFSDNGSPVFTETNQFQFATAPAPPGPAVIFRPDHVVVLMDENRTSYIQWALTNNSLFILTFDESYTALEDPNLYNHIPTLFVGPMIKPGNYFQDINHFNVLRTLEDIYHLPYAGAAATAGAITDIWLPPKLNVTPLAGGRLQITWPGAAILESATQPTGPFTEVTNATSPYAVTPTSTGFYRLKAF